MLFTTDRQTLDDLNIFGKHGGNSIFNIYNRTRTRGGAAILEEMFRYPLSDSNAINNRSAIIRQFAESGISFPFASAHFDEIEAYLANTDERTRLNAQEQSVGKKLSNMIAVDVETAVIYKGILALVAVLKETADFMALPALARITQFEQEKEAIKLLLAMPAMQPVLLNQRKARLPHAVMVAYDALFRFRHRDLMQQLLRRLYLLDVYMSVAQVANERHFVFPVALAGEGGIKLEGVYHPQVKGAVPNDIQIDTAGNVIFLTGANMAGKSTFMKSLSIALFVAHMGFPVAAAKMEFSVMDGIYTTINLPDNLGTGASHFYAEVLRVKKIVHELSQSKRLFIVFDEMFRGTNVKDAYEATIAITTGFALKKQSVFIISTHIIEAGDILKERCRNLRFYYLPTRMNGHTPVYTYRLEEGITADRHGMVIINNEGILEILKKGSKKNFKMV